MINGEKLVTDTLGRVTNKAKNLITAIDKVTSYQLYGSLVSARGTIIEARLPNSKIGDLCKIEDSRHNLELLAEVIALENNIVKLVPLGSIANISQDCKIKLLDYGFTIKVGYHLLGKVVNSFGEVMSSLNASDSNNTTTDDNNNDDQKESNKLDLDSFKSENRPVQAYAPDPLNRPLIEEPLLTGVKAIDLFNTCGIGQRIGIFAGPGVGKTTLMGMITRNAKVDIVIVALIGERGREVREFIDLELGSVDASRCILVVATSDRPAVEQLKCGYTAQTIAEYFRDQGKNVLLFVDSITRFARAGREVGLSSGEPITRGGFPPSVFLSFPKLMERAGNNTKGSISAFYTVLMEDEDIGNDPIADEVKSIIDGHIVLSRKLAEYGQFPAVDILKSLSRVADRIIDNEQLRAARHVKLLLSKYEELEFLIRIGEYKEGQDQLADESIRKYKKIVSLLKQNQRDHIDFEEAIDDLVAVAR